MTDKIIRQLIAVPGLKIECPLCNEEFSIKRARLFGMYDSYPPDAQKIIRERFEAVNELKSELQIRKKQLAEYKKKRPQKTSIAAQTINFGQISEQIIPAFLGFPYKQSECRILFKPIDYIVFNGLSGKGRVENIKFVDVKTGNNRLNLRQKQIRDCVTKGKIKHKVIGQ